MKHIVVLCDGMADHPLPELGNKTPMRVAVKPNMDYLARHGIVGMVQTVAPGMKPGSDICNLSILGYDPKEYYTGRSPLEAASMGIHLGDKDVALRCNLITLSDHTAFPDKIMVDYCADDISTEEARDLMKTLEKELGNDIFSFHAGVSYRNCLLWRNGDPNLETLTPPFDISDKAIGPYLPTFKQAKPLYQLMLDAHSILERHPINRKRMEKGLKPANAIWFWGAGQKTHLPPFGKKYNVSASMISAVDLLKGIGYLSDMNVVDVEDATGYIDTNFSGKAKAAIEELNDGQDFVYIHIEAPDECGHRGEIQNKVRSIELIDEKIIGPVMQSMQNQQQDFKIMILPDHPTPLSLKTHTADPVPFLFYSSAREYSSALSLFDEKHAASTEVFISQGHTLMQKFIDY